MEDTVKIKVAGDENHRDRISEVIQRLQSTGMNVEQSMEHLGMITGSIDPKKVGTPSHIKGVLHAEPAREIRLAPPESDIQ